MALVLILPDLNIVKIVQVKIEKVINYLINIMDFTSVVLTGTGVPSGKYSASIFSSNVLYSLGASLRYNNSSSRRFSKRKTSIFCIVGS